MALSDLDTIPETGAVFTIGRSRFADNIASHFFIRKDPVVSITCGDEHSAVICQTGRLFVFGSNDWGQLGLGHKNHISKPSCVKILKPEKVTHVACGRAHTLICTGAQKIFACGSDQEGQLGRGTSAIGDSASSPVLVYDSGLAGSKVVQLAAGSHHSLALTNDGGVLAWGSNLEGQLGLPDVSGLVNKPTKVHVPEPVQQISAGYYHSTFLTESGLVYVCGESESGKLGIDVNFSTQTAPKQMQLPSPAVQIACGGHHTIILAENGNMYCTGSNATGQLGLGTNVIELNVPKLLSRSALQNEAIARIACGESHTAIVTESGRLFTCGDGRHGKLGLEENENNVHELTLAPRYKGLFVTNVACGGCHTILVAHRRESSNPETDHIQKRSSLPPLKLPVNKLQNESHEGSLKEDGKRQLNEGNNNAMTPPIDEETTSADIHKNVKNSEKNVANNVPDSTNVTEKIESPKEPSEITAPKMSSDVSANETTPEVAAKEAQQAAEESPESTERNGNEESENDNEKPETEVDSENNVQERKKSATMNGERNHEETGSERDEENVRDHVEGNEENGRERTENSEENNSEDDKSKLAESMKETESNDKVKQETSPERQMSPSSSTPPPKPPRLKPGSGSNSSVERTSSTEQENEGVDEDNNETKEETTAKKPETTEDSESTTKRERSSTKRERSSTKSSTKSESSRSIRSRVEAEERIEVERQNDKVDGNDKVNEQEKLNDNAHQDDADVVQSPVLKPGKMAKMFRSKKQQGAENGTKAAGTVNNKSKSKTCAIL